MTAVENYQTATAALSARTQTEVQAIYARLAAGEITQDTAAVLIAATVNRANAAATALADVWLVAQIEELSGIATTTVGLPAVDDSDRLIQAAMTILGDRDSVDMRLDRLARAEPLESAHRATVDAIKEQPLVQGWTRAMDGDPCQLCRWWWRQGRVWPKAHPFQRHKGCNCQPRIVLAENIQSTGYTRQLERNPA
uniref:Phage head morphogenesis domain-containing protein n=1 Tax=Mycobacterium sp. (strain KMS) TaxID=189918 RepID=A1UHG2_MYCSK